MFRYRKLLLCIALMVAGTAGVGYLYASRTAGLPQAVAPVVSSGSASLDASDSIVNIGQAAIGRANAGDVVARIGAVRVYAPRPLANLPGNCAGLSLIELDDYAVFNGCLDGPAAGTAVDCDCADIDGSGQVDMLDFRLFMSLFGS